MQKRFFVSSTASRLSQHIKQCQAARPAILRGVLAIHQIPQWKQLSQSNVRPQRRPLHEVAISRNESSRVGILPSGPLVEGSHNDKLDSINCTWQHLDVDRLIPLLDEFLPAELRLSCDGSTEIRSAEHLPKLLHELRKHVPGGLLSQLVPEREHWESFVFLAQALADLKPRSESSFNSSDTLNRLSPWSESNEIGGRLAILTQKPLALETATSYSPTTSKLEALTSEPSASPHQDNIYLHEAMGEVWLALGEMIIEATEAKSSRSQLILGYALRVIAHLHSENHVPESVYQYEADCVPLNRRKSPYLHLMSSRILTAMSDATWRSQMHNFRVLYNSSPAQKRPYDGELIREAKQFQLHSLPTSTWLELILWCCQTNGHLLQAGMLLSDVFTGGTTKEWITFSWQEVLILQKDHYKRAQSWFDQVASLAEGWSGDKPLVEMEPESISTEVVQAVFDGLVARGHQSEEFRHLIASILEAKVRLANAYLTTSKSIDSNGSIAQALDYCLIDGMALTDIYLDARSYIYDASRQSLLQNVKRHSEGDSLSTVYGRNVINPVHSFLVSALDEAVSEGNVIEAEATLERFRRLRDIPGSFDNLRDSEADIPRVLLADLLLLATRTGRLDLAKRLIYGAKLISAVADTTLQPALLRVAIATSDDDLLAKIFQQFKTNPDSMEYGSIEGLLEAQIHFNKIEGLGRILWHLTKKRNRVLPPHIITALAIKLLDESPGADAEKLRDGVAHKLRKILGREYIPSRNHSLARDYTAHRQISQLARIFASVDGNLGEVATKFADVSNPQLSSPVAIDSEPFNALLGVVARNQGWLKARKLFDRWCDFECFDRNQTTEIISGLPVRKPRFGPNGEYVVKPDISSVQHVLLPSDAESLLRTFLDPAKHELMPEETRMARAQIEAEFQTDWTPTKMPDQVRWAITQYQRMKMSDEEIERLIPSLKVLEHGAKD